MELGYVFRRGRRSNEQSILQTYGAGNAKCKKPLATYALEREPCTRAVATHKARKSVLDGKDGWLQFCLEMDVHPIRLHSHVTEELKRFDTHLFSLFMAWKIPKMEKGRGRGNEIDSCYQYISKVKGWVNSEFGRKVIINQEWLREQKDAWKKAKLAAVGPRVRHRKLPFLATNFRHLQSINIDWNIPFCQVWWAAATLAFHIGLRSHEFTETANKPFNPNTCLTLGDLKWYRKNGTEFNPREFMHRMVEEGEYVTLSACQSKTDQTLEKYGGLCFVVVHKRGTSCINACESLAQQERVRQVWDKEDRNKACLFENPATRRPVKYAEFSSFMKTVLTYAYGEKIASKHGTHGFRIGGATSMRLMNKSDDEIMAWGRWSSDAYKRYVRDCLSNMISKSTLMDAPEDIAMDRAQAATGRLPPLSTAEARRGLTTRELRHFTKSQIVKPDFQDEPGWQQSDDEESLVDVAEEDMLKQFVSLQLQPVPVSLQGKLSGLGGLQGRLPG